MQHSGQQRSGRLGGWRHGKLEHSTPRTAVRKAVSGGVHAEMRGLACNVVAGAGGGGGGGGGHTMEHMDGVDGRRANGRSGQSAVGTRHGWSLPQTFLPDPIDSWRTRGAARPRAQCTGAFTPFSVEFGDF